MSSYIFRMASDQVDLIIEQWRNHQSSRVDPSPLAVTGRVLQIAQHIERTRLRVLNTWGLTLADFDVLATLNRSAPDRSVNPRHLLVETMITSGAMTTRLDRLETLGCIRRAPDPADRRGVLVSLTDKGRTIAAQAFAAVMAAEASLLSGIGATDRRHLDASLRKLALECRPMPLGA